MVRPVADSSTLATRTGPSATFVIAPKKIGRPMPSTATAAAVGTGPAASGSSSAHTAPVPNDATVTSRASRSPRRTRPAAIEPASPISPVSANSSPYQAVGTPSSRSTNGGTSVVMPAPAKPEVSSSVSIGRMNAVPKSARAPSAVLRRNSLTRAATLQLAAVGVLSSGAAEAPVAAEARGAAVAALIPSSAVALSR
ncbi:hypothetical protein Val02_47500 [Virgisporangium aliadipatigenens]|uniref:Uncharacterized protein n=1 Tax=Virgisporangium aliadipatigenens TaxID=741659 RepID=A0A8J3YLU2_9ACTN|nr:hypothetical protein Val02_47500 [Virgisporangium aliadipatigenens]